MDTQRTSEVARLLARIRDEYESARRAVHGLSRGAAQHRIISQKTVRMYLWQEELEAVVGEDVALVLVEQQLAAVQQGGDVP